MLIFQEITKPSDAQWIHGRTPSSKTRLVEWLVSGCFVGKDPCPDSPKEPQHAEYPGYDGWYNNLAHPELGAAGKKAFFINDENNY